MCELDLVFNFYKVYQILDEMVVGGEVMETSKACISRAMKSADYYEWSVTDTATNKLPNIDFQEYEQKRVKLAMDCW